ncbi:hypothetical protein HAX54_014034 [Datura stramonium]|uniref:NB-ARC domain-containing protein n=1 Tax=Datura stramonium TaxID=4076 RepID=A0ABS8TPX7_DATST|nr:hypothetical protein [Datura stramonium]
MKGILRQLNAEDSGTDKGDLLTRILQALSHKSYLIVMDDVWSIDDGWWDRISKGLPKFIEHNSCIIITLMKHDVVKRMGVTETRIHRPRLLDEDESWSLFCKFALFSTKGSVQCLVEAVQRRNFDGRVYSCKMHDMVRDMTILVAEEESLAGNSKLRALILTTTNCIGFNRKIALAEIKTLRVLDLSCVKLENICLMDLWQWITSLKRLAYLNLRDVAKLDEIPDSIRKLWGLQILVLRECKELKKLPTSITTLPRLAILDVGSCPSFSCLPQGLSRLSNLEELYGFKIPSPATTEACRLSEDCLEILAKVGETWETFQSAMPALKYLEVSHCNSLKKFPCNVEGLGYWTKPEEEEEDKEEQDVISCQFEDKH